MKGDPKRCPLLAPLNHMGRSHPPRLAVDRITDVSIYGEPLQQSLASDPTISQFSTKMFWQIPWCRGSFFSFDPEAREDALYDKIPVASALCVRQRPGLIGSFARWVAGT